jgi:hypothetical protein
MVLDICCTTGPSTDCHFTYPCMFPLLLWHTLRQSCRVCMAVAVSVPICGSHSQFNSWAQCQSSRNAFRKLTWKPMAMFYTCLSCFDGGWCGCTNQVGSYQPMHCTAAVDTVIALLAVLLLLLRHARLLALGRTLLWLAAWRPSRRRWLSWTFSRRH